MKCHDSSPCIDLPMWSLRVCLLNHLVITASPRFTPAVVANRQSPDTPTLSKWASAEFGEARLVRRMQQSSVKVCVPQGRPDRPLLSRPLPPPGSRNVPLARTCAASNTRGSRCARSILVRRRRAPRRCDIRVRTACVSVRKYWVNPHCFEFREMSAIRHVS